MAFSYFVDSSPAVGRPGEVHDTQKNDLGAIRVGNDGSEYIYLAGVASLVDGDWVSYQPSVFTAVRLKAGAKGSVAIATAAVVAGKYGWFLISGQDTATCESSILSNGYCFAMATEGRVDDTAVAGDQVIGAVTRTAGVAGGTATVQIDRPKIGVHNLLGQSA